MLRGFNPSPVWLLYWGAVVVDAVADGGNDSPPVLPPDPVATPISVLRHSWLSRSSVFCVQARLTPWMKEVRDNTSREGGLPTLPGRYLSTFQPSQRGFF
jgi:hypothetical protein